MKHFSDILWIMREVYLNSSPVLTEHPKAKPETRFVSHFSSCPSSDHWILFSNPCFGNFLTNLMKNPDIYYYYYYSVKLVCSVKLVLFSQTCMFGPILPLELKMFTEKYLWIKLMSFSVESKFCGQVGLEITGHCTSVFNFLLEIARIYLVHPLKTVSWDRICISWSTPYPL